jgi:hypothetical protein
MDDKSMHHHHHHHHHHPHRYGVNNDPKDGEMEKRPTFTQNMDEYIFKNPPFPHPPIHPQPKLRSELRALMDDKPI